MEFKKEILNEKHKSVLCYLQISFLKNKMDETCTSVEIYQHEILIYTREEPEACNLNEQTAEMRLNVPLFYFWRKVFQKTFVSGFLCRLIAFFVTNSQWQCLVSAAVLFITLGFWREVPHPPTTAFLSHSPFCPIEDDWLIPFNLDKGGNRKTNCHIDTGMMGRSALVTGEVRRRSACLEKTDEESRASQNHRRCQPSCIHTAATDTTLHLLRWERYALCQPSY